MRQSKLLRILAYLMSIAFGREPIVALPTISDNRATRSNRGLNESFQGNRSHVRKCSQTNPPNSFGIFVFNGDSNGDLTLCSAPTLSRFLLPSNIGLVCLHNPSQPVTARPNHSTAQLMKPLPGCLVASKSQSSLQAKSVGTIFLAGYVPHRPKPNGQRTADPMKNGTGCDRGLTIARPAMPKPTGSQPCVVAPTLWTHKSIRPTTLGQVPETVFLGSKLFLEFRQRPWVAFFLHNTAYYMLRSLESSRYPTKQKARR